MRTKLIMLIFLIAGTGVLSGCLEDTNVALHEPGVYMGPQDPLVGMGSQSSVLKERFSMGQTDR